MGVHTFTWVVKCATNMTFLDRRTFARGQLSHPSCAIKINRVWHCLISHPPTLARSIYTQSGTGLLFCCP